MFYLCFVKSTPITNREFLYNTMCTSQSICPHWEYFQLKLYFGRFSARQLEELKQQKRPDPSITDYRKGNQYFYIESSITLHIL